MRLAEAIERATVTVVGAGRVRDYSEPPGWAHEGQREFWRDSLTATYASMVAGTQVGKSAIAPHLLARNLQRCGALFAAAGFGAAIYAGPTLALLRAQAIPMFVRFFAEEEGLGRMTYSPKPVFTFSQDGLYKMFGRADFPVSVHFGYLNDSSNVESLTAGCAHVDEAGQKECKRDAFEALLRRVSVAQSAGLGQVTLSTTPYEFNSFKTMFYDPWEAGDRRFSVTTCPSWANPMQDREAIESFRSMMPEWRWSMMYEGRFTRPAGSVLDCLTAESVVDDFPLPRDWPVFVGLDFGGVNTAAAFLVGDPRSDKFYVFNSYKRVSSSVADHVSFIKLRATNQIERAMGGSPSEQEWRDSFARAGLPVSRPRLARFAPGVAHMYGLIKTGRLLFFRHGASALVDECTRYSYEVGDDGLPDGEKVADQNEFHRVDALRYGCQMVQAVAPPIDMERFL